MKIKLLVYGVLRDYFASESGLDFDKELSVSDFLVDLVGDIPRLLELVSRSRVVLNNDFVLGDTMLKDGDVVLLFPPSSGG